MKNKVILKIAVITFLMSCISCSKKNYTPSFLHGMSEEECNTLIAEKAIPYMDSLIEIHKNEPFVILNLKPLFPDASSKDYSVFFEKYLCPYIRKEAQKKVITFSVEDTVRIKL